MLQHMNNKSKCVIEISPPRVQSVFPNSWNEARTLRRKAPHKEGKARIFHSYDHHRSTVDVGFSLCHFFFILFLPLPYSSRRVTLYVCIHQSLTLFSKVPSVFFSFFHLSSSFFDSFGHRRNLLLSHIEYTHSCYKQCRYDSSPVWATNDIIPCVCGIYTPWIRVYLGWFFVF